MALKRFKLAAFLLAIMLGGCDSGDKVSPSFADQARPALYAISNAKGENEGYVFGTIHSLPDGVNWQTEKLEAALKAAPALVVEIANINDEGAIYSAFSTLAISETALPIEMRVPESMRAELAHLVEKSGADPVDLSHMDSWAAAILLSNANNYGSPDNGTDKAILAQFEGKDITGLESASQQFSFFDSLAEDDQRAILIETINAYSKGTKDAEVLTAAWIQGDLTLIERESGKGMMADTDIRGALLTRRNQLWAVKIDALAQNKPPLFIAVGAAHLPGPEGLLTLLEKQGYSIKRIQ